MLSSTVPTCHTYDPAYVYEIAVIVQDGMRRMYQEGEDRFYYITVYNEDYPMPEMPKGVEQGILRGIYKYRTADKGKAVVQLFGSGSILNEALRAQEILAEKYGVAADVWSVTSYNELRRDALARRALEPAASRRAGETALHSRRAARRRWSHYRGDRLHEGGAGPACSLAARTGWSRWAPTVSGAATIASTCGGTSR